MYVFPRRLNLGKYVTVSLPIIPLDVTNNLLSNLHDHYFPYPDIYETSNTQTITIKTVTVIYDYNVMVIYKSYNNCTQKTLF